MKIAYPLLLVTALLSACSRAPGKTTEPDRRPAIEYITAEQTSADARALGPTKDTITVGEPKSFENLTVFPIHATTQVDVGPMTTLDAALKKGEAEVREVGREAGDAPDAQVQSRGGGGPTVNTLVIENKGKTPIFVLAGTVVKGGNQDRQIAQDFVIDGEQKVPVDAFCVEHGRWSPQRDGRATGGKFGSVAQVVTSEVRKAGQYKKNQSEVWSKVAEVNQTHKKQTQSGTLMATLDDGEVAAKRRALAEAAVGWLASVQPNDTVVGYAYAVDGQVRGARWFANHAIFALHRATLIEAAAVDAITEAAKRGGARAPEVKLGPAAVTAFLASAEEPKVEEARETPAANTNEYKESEKAYRSKTTMKAKGGRGKGATISSDYLKK